jgi:hypothetical protein
MSKYKAVLFAPDGEWVTDYRESDSIEQVQELISNQGSRWFFYPFSAVITDNDRGFTTETQRIVDTWEPFKFMQGRTIRSFSKMIADLPLHEMEHILNG